MNKRLLNFLLEGNLFIAACAVGMAMETSVLLGQAFHESALYAFIFFATLFSYNLYYIFSIQFAYHRPLMFAGLAGCVVSLSLMKHIPFLQLGIISFLSVLYMLPVFTPVGRNKTYQCIKLLLLILVWFWFTFLLPAVLSVIHVQTIVFAAHRFIFLSALCLLFFIKDAGDAALRRIAIRALYFTVLLQLLLSLWILFRMSVPIGLIDFLVSAWLLYDARIYPFTSKTQREYLLFVDGKMLLQSIFVLIYSLLTNESGIFTQ